MAEGPGPASSYAAPDGEVFQLFLFLPGRLRQLVYTAFKFDEGVVVVLRRVLSVLWRKET
jgi:hypothetical protein